MGMGSEQRPDEIDLLLPANWPTAEQSPPVFLISEPEPKVEPRPFHRGGRSHVLELLVALLALGLNAWRLDQNGFGNSYYAAAIRSMTNSWKAFLYASLDPGSWITLDKPPGAYWLQALSARVFGYSSWSLLLPSAFCAALAVYLLTVTVRRVWGTTAGLVAGVAFALTPVVVAVGRSNNPDATLMLSVVAAAWATERSITTRRVRWMLLAGAFCGFGFLSKLLVAGLVMPGLWLGYLIAAKPPFAKRCLHLIAAATVFAAVSLSWIAVVDLVPASSRPYIGGSTNGKALDLALGYRGIGRLTGATEFGAPVGGGRPGGFPGSGSGSLTFAVDEFGGTTGIGRLFNNGMGDQVMWLAPIAAVSFLAALASAIKRRTRDARLGSTVMFGGWAAVTYVTFAFISGVFHNYYVALLAPALAAFIGIGAALTRDAGRAGRAMTALSLVGTAALQIFLVHRVGTYGWVRTAAAIAIGVSVVGLATTLASKRLTSRRALLSVGIAAVAVLIAPATWSFAGTTHPQSGTFPDARPSLPGGATGLPGGLGGGPGGGRGPGGFGGGLDEAMLTWLRAQQTTQRWIVAVPSAMQASSALIAGDSVMAIGGFSGSDNTMSPARLAGLIDAGELRFMMTSGGFGGAPGQGSGLSTVVHSTCAPIPAETWGGSGSSGLYDCAGKSAALRAAPVPAANTSQASANTNGGQSNPGVFEKCMQDNGAPAPTGKGPGGVNINDPAVARALAACAGSFGGGSFPPGAAPAN